MPALDVEIYINRCLPGYLDRIGVDMKGRWQPWYRALTIVVIGGPVRRRSAPRRADSS